MDNLKSNKKDHNLIDNLYAKRGIDFAKKDVHKAINLNKPFYPNKYKFVEGNMFAAAITGFIPE